MLLSNNKQLKPNGKHVLGGQGRFCNLHGLKTIFEEKKTLMALEPPPLNEKEMKKKNIFLSPSLNFCRSAKFVFMWNGMSLPEFE